MAITYLDNIDLKQNQLLNPVAQNLSTAPSSPVEGQWYYDSTVSVKTLKFWNGTAWIVFDATKASNIPLSAIASVGSNTILGNVGASAASPSALTGSQVKSILAITSSDVSGFTAAVEAVRLDQMAAPTADVNFNGKKITSLASPITSTDAANKAYVDAQAQSAASGIDPKDAVIATTVANITLSGTQTIDGVAVAVGDRVLVKNQTTASENGLYVVAAGSWSRSADGVQGELTNGALVLSTGGTTQAGTQWYLQTADPITVGTTALTFSQFGAGGTYTADASGGLNLAGSAFSVKLPANSGLTTDATGLYVNNAIYGRKYSANVGDGSSTTINVTHSLGTQDVIVQLRNNASPYDVQYATVECTNTSTVTCIFSTAPASNALRVTVIG